MPFLARHFIFDLAACSPHHCTVCNTAVMVCCCDRWQQQIFVPLYLDNHLRLWIGRRQEVSCACPVYVCSRVLTLLGLAG